MTEPVRILRLAEAVCRQRGVRLTRQRRRVLEILGNSEKPLGAYDILARLQQRDPRAAPPTVYRALEFLLGLGLVHKLESLHAYIGCRHPDHPHAGQFLICTRCGDVTELEDSDITETIGLAARATGFRPERGIIEVAGRCADCMAENG